MRENRAVKSNQCKQNAPTSDTSACLRAWSGRSREPPGGRIAGLQQRIPEGSRFTRVVFVRGKRCCARARARSYFFGSLKKTDPNQQVCERVRMGEVDVCKEHVESADRASNLDLMEERCHAPPLQHGRGLQERA